MAIGDPQSTFPAELRLQKLHLKFRRPRSSNTDIKITIKGNNGRKVESEKRSQVEKGTTLEVIECEIGGKPWTEDIESFRIDESTTIQLRLTKAGSFRIPHARESSVVRWSHIKSANRTGDEIVYETEDSDLKATIRLQFQASPAENRFEYIEGRIQKATLSQDHREETTSKLKSIDNTVKPILEVLEKVALIHPAASAVVGIVKVAYDRLIDRQIKYDEVVRSLLQNMTDIHPFARVASMTQSGDLGLVHKMVAEMLNLIQDACEVIAAPNHTEQGAHLKVLTAVSKEDLVQEFKRKLDVLIKNFNMAINTEVHAKVMTADQKAEAAEIKEWLTSLDAIKRFNSIISTHVSGTGSWFLEREDIQAWIAGESDTTKLFCIGIPGCGKTMMISLVCKTLLQRYQKCRNTAILRLYFDHKDPKTYSFDDILLSFTRQLIQQGQPTPEWIRHYYHEHSNFKDIETLRIQLSTQLKSYYSTVFILADALDECPLNVQRKFLEFLELVSVNTHVFLTSRPGQGGIPEDSSFWTTVDLQADSGDVLKYVERRLVESDDPDMLNNHEDLRTDIKSKVLSNADGVMLLAKLQMDAITEQNTLAGVRHVLENLPDGLDATFEETIQRIKKQKSSDAKLAMKTLLWIVGAERPLSVRELKCATALESTEPYFDEQAQPTTNTMTRVCAGLVIIDGDEANDDENYSFVRLVHLTVQEYFTRIKERFFDNMQLQLASLCLTYLLWVSRQGAIYRDSQSILFWYNKDIPVFLQYCSAEWPRHSSGCQLQVLDLLLEVLQNDVAVEYSFRAINHFRWSDKLDGTALHLLAYHGLQEILNFILCSGKSDPLLSTVVAGMKLAKAVQKSLLEKSDIKVAASDKDKDARTPLSYAAGYGHLNVVKLLLEKGDIKVDHKDEKGRTPLSYTVEEGHLDVLQVLLEKGDVKVDQKDKEGRTPLSYAAEYGHLDLVSALLEKDEVTVDDKDKNGRTPLSYAAGYGHLGVLKLLLVEDKVVADARDEQGRMPLSYAARYGHLDVVKALLVNGNVAAEDKDESGRTPLSYAAEYGHLEVVKALLVEDDIAVDEKDESGRTPLLYAAQCGHLDIFKAILLNDKTVIHDGRKGKIQRPSASQNGTVEVMNTSLEQSGSEITDDDNYGRRLLSSAAMGGNLEVFNLILEQWKLQAAGRDIHGRSLLSYAAAKGNIDVVKALLMKDDIEPDDEDEEGRTPLSYAAQNGTPEIISALLEQREVQSPSKDLSDGIPLSHAAITGHIAPMITLMGRRGVRPDSKDGTGRTPLSYAAEEGHLEAIKILLAQEAVKADVKDKRGRTALSYAAESFRENLEVISTLLAQNWIKADERDSLGRTPLSHAAGKGRLKVVNALLAREDVDADGIDDEGNSPLIHATKSYWLTSQTISSLLAHGVQVNCKDDTGRTPLSYAVQRGDINIVNLFLARDRIKADEEDNRGRTPLSYAAESGRLDVVNALLPKVEICGKDNEGRSVLSYSAQYGHIDIVNTLMTEEKIKVDDKDKKGRSALTLAAEYGHLEVVTTLLAQDTVEADGRDKEGRTPLSLSAEYGHLDVLNCLLAQHGVDGDSKDNNGITPLSYAAQYGHTDCLKELLAREEVSADSKDIDGRTPLSHAAQNGHIDAVKELLMRDEVDVNSRDKYRRTPLSYAALYGHLDLAEELLGRDGVEQDCLDIWRKTPFMYAAEYGHLHVVTTLLAIDKIELDAKDKCGKTPLMYAAEYGHLDVLNTLMAQGGVDVNHKDNCGRTALMYAAWSGHVPVVNTLIGQDKVDLTLRDKTGSELLAYAVMCPEEKGDVADLILGLDGTAADAVDMRGRAPISYAASNGNLGAAKLLIAREDVQVDRKDIKGKTPLGRAAQRGHADVVIAMLAHENVDINSRNHKGLTPLSTAARLGHVDVIKALLAEGGVEVNSQDNDGRTPLSYAAEEGYEEVVRRLLLVEGIEVHLANKSGTPSIMFAELNSNSKIVAMLEEQGAVPELADTLAALFTCELLCTLCLIFCESADRFISEMIAIMNLNGLTPAICQ